MISFPVYLVGARGCGKTTVGKLLAEQLDYKFCDTDQQLQANLNQSIADIVAKEGWDYFRQQEHQTLVNASSESTVIATGGGIILREDNCQHMRHTGKIIWLDVDHHVLVERLTADPEASLRPSLTGRPITEEIFDILQQRNPLYHQVAHYRINANQSPERAVIDILTLLSREALTS